LRNITTIAILVLFALQAGGILFVLQVQQTINSLTIKEQLSEKNTHYSQIEISKSALKKIEINDDEIYYQGEYYDIKEIIQHGDSYKIIAFKDSEEKSIREKIKSIFENKKDQKNKNPIAVIKLLSLVYITTVIENGIIIPAIKENKYQSIIENLINTDKAIPTPPPLFC